MTPATASDLELRVMGLHRSVAGLCIILLLTAGLLSMPTSCDCGAGIAHGHSLFILAGHHHGSDGIAFGVDRDDHSQHHHLEGSSAEPKLLGRIAHYSDRIAVAMPPFELTSQPWQRVSQPMLSNELHVGRTDEPNAPPPRSTFTG